MGHQKSIRFTQILTWFAETKCFLCNVKNSVWPIFFNAKQLQALYTSICCRGGSCINFRLGAMISFTNRMEPPAVHLSGTSVPVPYPSIDGLGLWMWSINMLIAWLPRSPNLTVWFLLVWLCKRSCLSTAITSCFEWTAESC